MGCIEGGLYIGTSILDVAFVMKFQCYLGVFFRCNLLAFDIGYGHHREANRLLVDLQMNPILEGRG